MEGDGEYLDPIVAAIVGDNSGLLTTITESQAAMSEFAASAPAIGSFGPHANGGGAEEAAAALSAGMAAAAAAAPELDEFAPWVEAAGSAGEQAGHEFGRHMTDAEIDELEDEQFEQLMAHLRHLNEAAAETGTEMGTELGRNLSEAEIAALSDSEFETYVQRLQDSVAAAAATAANSSGSAAMQARWESWAKEAEAAEEASAAVTAAGDAEEEAGAKAEDAGRKAAASGKAAAGAAPPWMLLGAAFLGITAGPLAMSTAVVGVGYEIAKFGGEAQGQLQIVDEAFRTSAAHAAQAYLPAIQNIEQGLVSMARGAEAPMSAMFTELSGPAEDFFHGLEASARQGMDSAVTAVGQLGPVISQVGYDLGPVLSGLAAFGGEFAQTFTANGGNDALTHFADDMGRLLPIVGQLAGEVGGGLLPVLDGTSDVLRIVGDVLNGLGSPIDYLIGGGIAIATVWDKGTQAAKSLASAWNSGISTLEAASARVATFMGIEQAEATAAGEAAVAQESRTIATEAASAADEEAAQFAAAFGVELDGETAAAGEAATAQQGRALATQEAAVADEEATVAAGEAAAAIEAEGVAAGGAIAAFSGLLAAIAPLAAIAGFGIIGWNVGEAIGNGINDGMASSQGSIIDRIGEMSVSIAGAFASKLGISSPSRVMADLSEEIPNGVAQGVTAGTHVAAAAAAGLANSMVNSFSSGVSGGGGLPSGGGGYGPSYGGGGGGNTITINLHIEAPLASASASEIADAVIPALQEANILNGQSMASHNGIKGGAGR